jgi:Protein of unknown function (DUF2950)
LSISRKRRARPARLLTIIRCLGTIALAWCSLPAYAGEARQESFASPDAAIAALITAIRGDQTDNIVKILGPDSHNLVYSGDAVADDNARNRFVSAYDKAHQIQLEGQDKAVLILGEKNWPLPIPLVKQDSVWRFDTRAGEEEILNRRIGRNELGAIQVSRAIVDAQRDYAARIGAGNGIVEYAQHFVSSAGKHDGLYWPTSSGQEQSPIGPLLANARAEGYGEKIPSGKREPYHGYYYRMLKRQGKDASGGAYDYQVNGHMIGGFAVVAFPAKYGASGIMTFIVNQDGIVYQKNLGPETTTIARRMTTFNPDKTWAPVSPND